MPQTPIRLARTEDGEAVRKLVRDAYAHYVTRIGREPGPMGDDYPALIVAGRVHVIEEDGRLLGLAVLIPEADAMLLDNVAVDPASQGKGIGRRLLDFAEHRALESGYASIRLYTNEAMTENLALYTRLGYAETHRGQEKGLRRVYMAKQLG